VRGEKYVSVLDAEAPCKFKRRRKDLVKASDRELVALVAKHSVGAFEELYRRHAGAVTGKAKRLFADANLATEVTDVAFMQLWDRADRLNAEGPVRGWLARVAHNAAVDCLRRNRPLTYPLVYALGQIADVPGPDDEVIMKEQRNDIRDALRELPASQRNAIELSFFCGLSQREIAHLTGEPLGTVKGRIRLGIQRLRRANAIDHSCTFTPARYRKRL
jgi:RNA polymerase sigma-70 factor (ECF subfamily)